MFRYAVARVLGLIPVLFVAVVVTFVAIQFVPGDPIMILLSNQSGDPVPEARLRAEYGLDRPLIVQFLDYLAGILTGDFGLSFRFASVPVIDVLSTGLAISPILAQSAICLALPVGVHPRHVRRAAAQHHGRHLHHPRVPGADLRHSHRRHSRPGEADRDRRPVAGVVAGHRAPDPVARCSR